VESDVFGCEEECGLEIVGSEDLLSAVPASQCYDYDDICSLACALYASCSRYQMASWWIVPDLSVLVSYYAIYVECPEF
jgi:hypothetical protein